jgi:hypothetical protein
MKKLTITPPEGYEVDEKLSTFQNIVFKEINKRLEYGDLYPILGNRLNECPLAPHWKYSQAYEALCKLLFFSEHQNFNGQPQSEWADWTNDNHKANYSIVLASNDLCISESFLLKKVLSFKTRELAEKFLKDYEQELLIAAPLL